MREYPVELDMEAEFDVYCPDCDLTYPDHYALMWNRFQGEAICPEGHHISIDLYTGPD